MVGGRGGFTLVEALVALAISSILLVLVSTTFLVQNTFYANVLQRGRLQENARSVADIVAGDLRAVMPGGIVTADSARLVVRVPMALGMICGASGGNRYVHLVGGSGALDQSVTPRVAHRSSAGAWTYYTETWASIVTSGSPAGACAGNGFDVTNVTGELFTIASGGVGSVGDVFMVYRETEFRIQASSLDPSATALYRGPSGGTLVEMATPVAPDAHFAYRKGSSWFNQVTSGLDAIDHVRIYAHARGPAEAASQEDLQFDLVMDVPLRNVL